MCLCIEFTNVVEATQGADAGDSMHLLGEVYALRHRGVNLHVHVQALILPKATQIWTQRAQIGSGVPKL